MRLFVKIAFKIQLNLFVIFSSRIKLKKLIFVAFKTAVAWEISGEI